MSDPAEDTPALELLPEEVAPSEAARATKMVCPYCGAEHDPDQQGRFCDGCGLSIAPPPKLVLSQGGKKAKGEPARSLCAMCGSPFRGGKCPSCG